MLRIRVEQYAAFQPVAETDFASRIAEHLRTEHARTVVRRTAGPTLISRFGDEELLTLIRSGIARARSHGLTWESSITAFVVLMFKAAPNFDQHPEIRALLTKDERPEDERLRALLQKTTSAAWTKIREQYDVAAWNGSERAGT
jgi:hypothetical protein